MNAKAYRRADPSQMCFFDLPLEIREQIYEQATLPANFFTFPFQAIKPETPLAEDTKQSTDLSKVNPSTRQTILEESTWYDTELVTMMQEYHTWGYLDDQSEQPQKPFNHYAKEIDLTLLATCSQMYLEASEVLRRKAPLVIADSALPLLKKASAATQERVYNWIARFNHIKFVTTGTEHYREKNVQALVQAVDSRWQSNYERRSLTIMYIGERFAPQEIRTVLATQPNGHSERRASSGCYDSLLAEETRISADEMKQLFPKIQIHTRQQKSSEPEDSDDEDAAPQIRQISGQRVHSRLLPYVYGTFEQTCPYSPGCYFFNSVLRTKELDVKKFRTMAPEQRFKSIFSGLRRTQKEFAEEMDCYDSTADWIEAVEERGRY